MRVRLWTRGAAAALALLLADGPAQGTAPTLMPAQGTGPALMAAVEAQAPRPVWPQWGGADRNFVAPPAALATSWPADGPRRLWTRPLGNGLSAIVTDGTTLFTMHRDGDQDVVSALDAGTGGTRWEARYAAPFAETCSHRLGPVPRATPLLAAGRVITISAGGLMNSFDAATGARAWTVDLLGGTPAAVRACGYASSPLAHNGRVIAMGGPKGRGVVAVDAATGKIAWTGQDFENGYSSPLLIQLDGRPELVVFTAAEISGLNPDTGALEWTYPHPAEFGVNVATPIWGDDNVLVVSSAYGGGTRALKLARTASGVSVRERWATQRVRIHFGNAVRIAGHVYASNGDVGSAPLAAIDIATGEMTWRSRAVGRATLVASGAHLILLDEEGNLALGTPGADGLQVHAKAQVLESPAWTPPTLAGSVLFLRDTRTITAIDLAATR